MNGQWSRETFDAVISILRRTRLVDYSTALADISRLTGLVVTESVLRGRFKRAGLGAPSGYCSAASAGQTHEPIYSHGAWVHGPPSYNITFDTAAAVARDTDDDGPVTERAPRVESVATPPEVPIAAVRIEAPRTSDEMIEERAAERERRRLKAEHATLIDRLQDANARAGFVDAIRAPVTPRIDRREVTSGLREGALVVLLSDWHLEEIVTLESTAGRNEYNLAIGAQRARRFFQGVRWLLNYHRQSFALRELVLWLGGDLMSGFIHPELTETNELSPVEAVLHVKQILVDGLATLLADEKLERIILPCNSGNHGRITEKRRVKNVSEMSYEWLLYNVLASEHAKESRLEFHIPRSAHTYVEAFNHMLHFHHGDDVAYHGGVGGLAIPLNKRVAQWNTVRRADYHHIGHWHQVRDFGDAIVNGSLIGYSEYALSIGAKYEGAAQQSYVLDAKHGKTMVAPIWVDGESQERAA